MPDALIEVHTLTDGGQTALDTARKIAAFVDGAKETLELALYDVRLQDETGDIVRSALVGAHERGVHVRLVYNMDEVDERPPVPPPPTTEPDLIESLPFETAAVPGWPDLMHHKYVVRDRDAVWSGSTNWTDDSWTREENVIVIVESKKLAHRIADRIGAAKSRVRVASPVISSAPILGTLAEVAADGKVDLAGVVDATQIAEVLEQWRRNGNMTWKGPSLRFLLNRATFSGKRSTPYAPGSVHDYMHAKVTVADDTVFIGSFNLSHSGETNAENVLEIEDAALAERMAGFVDSIRARYPALALD